MCDRSPIGHRIKPEFLTRIEMLNDIQPRLRYLVDVDRHTSSKPRMWQQGEPTAAMTRMQRDGRDLTLTGPELLELANATHEVTHNYGRLLRRELLRDTTNLRVSVPGQDVGNTRVYRGSGLEARLTDLVNEPAPSSPVARYSTPANRLALRATLDAAPTLMHPPSPFPAARGFGAYDDLGPAVR